MEYAAARTWWFLIQRTWERRHGAGNPVVTRGRIVARRAGWSASSTAVRVEADAVARPGGPAPTARAGCAPRSVGTCGGHLVARRSSGTAQPSWTSFESPWT